MKIEQWIGCTAYGIAIDGVRIEHMDKSAQEVAYDRVLRAVRAGLKDGTVSLDSVIGTLQYDTTEPIGGTCDQCGDSVEKTTWNINEESEISNGNSSGTKSGGC